MEVVRTEQAGAARPAAPRVARMPAPAALGPGARPDAVLALQRSAGNAVTGASLRMLARCGAGGCTCGGKCGGHGERKEPDELELQRMAATAPAARRSRATARVHGAAPPLAVARRGDAVRHGAPAAVAAPARRGARCAPSSPPSWPSCCCPPPRTRSATAPPRATAR